MATLALQRVRAAAGTTVTRTAAAVGGDRCPVGDNVLLHVRNGGGSSINVTLDSTGKTFNGSDVPDTVVAVAAGAEAIIPITADYRSASDGLAGIAYSGVTTVTVAALAI